MDSRLYTFVMVAKIGNYTKAAESLNLTQPAVYKQIQYLEQYYNTLFFKKEGKKLVLTDEGELFLQYAKQIINLHENLKEKLNHKDINYKKYKIGATMTIGDYILPKVIYDYMERHKNINIILRVNNTNIILKKLLEREISLALIEGPFDKTKYKYRKFKDDELVLVAPTKGPLSKKESMTLEELLEQKLILREKVSGTRKIIEGALISKGYSDDVLNHHIEISSINGIKTLVKEGLGYTILSKESVKAEIIEESMKIIPIENISIVREFNFVYAYDESMEFIEDFMKFSLERVI